MESPAIFSSIYGSQAARRTRSRSWTACCGCGVSRREIMTEGTVDVRASGPPDDLGNHPQDRRVPHGVQILHDPRLDKGTAFTASLCVASAA
jgi:hypothetical protein